MEVKGEGEEALASGPHFIARGIHTEERSKRPGQFGNGKNGEGSLIVLLHKYPKLSFREMADQRAAFI